LVRRGPWERWFAFELIAHHNEAQQAIHMKDVAAFGRGIAGWGEVDSFCCYIAGPAWRMRKISNATVGRWARSKDRWWRRAALVSTVPLNSRMRGGSGDTARTLDVCRRLVDDRDDMVVKALSWALRELSKRDRSAVESFVQKNAHRLSPRVIREVHNKLSTGVKNPHRRSPSGKRTSF
jgi:3-methyladenine DNA glycosylase AlkD